MRLRVRVQLTSLSLFSYLLAFLPWLFLLSFFRSDWDLSRESCFILCSIWYLLNVAWSRGEIHVSAVPEPKAFRRTGSILQSQFSELKLVYLSYFQPLEIWTHNMSIPQCVVFTGHNIMYNNTSFLLIWFHLPFDEDSNTFDMILDTV